MIFLSFGRLLLAISGDSLISFEISKAPDTPDISRDILRNKRNGITTTIVNSLYVLYFEKIHCYQKTISVVVRANSYDFQKNCRTAKMDSSDMMQKFIVKVDVALV